MQGTTWAAMIPATACDAPSMSLNRAIMALEAFGGGMSLSVTLLVTARVPSEPTSSGAML